MEKKFINPIEYADAVTHTTSINDSQSPVKIVLRSDTARPTKFGSEITLKVDGLDVSLAMFNKGARINNPNIYPSRVTAKLKDVDSWRQIVDLVTRKTPRTSPSN